MGNKTCCVVNCKNNGRNSKRVFYLFPKASLKTKQRDQWISSVRRINSDGSRWNPKLYDLICNEHFIGGKKSDDELHPSYVPSIFPDVYKNRLSNLLEMINRNVRSFFYYLHTRYIRRQEAKKWLNNVITSESSVAISQENNIEMADIIIDAVPMINSKNTHIHQTCQIDLFDIDNVSSKPSKLFICNRYIYINYCEAEIQTNIVECKGLFKIPNNKLMKNKGYNSSTPLLSFVDNSVQTDSENDWQESRFKSFVSVKNNEQLRDLCGVIFENFYFLLERLPNSSHSCTRKISNKNRLLIFLTKMKTGITFAAMSVLFGVHRTTISRIFYSVLSQLRHTTSTLIFWPRKEVIQRTIPDCFYPDHSNTRVIIDCTEFKIAVPSSGENGVYCFSNYRRGFTAKLLIGITPAGLISLISKVAGGRKSDSHLQLNQI